MHPSNPEERIEKLDMGVKENALLVAPRSEASLNPYSKVSLIHVGIHIERSRLVAFYPEVQQNSHRGTEF